jgi:hypothetical protein
MAALTDVDARPSTSTARLDAERPIPLTAEGAPEAIDVATPVMVAAPPALEGVATVDSAEARSAVNPVAASPQQQEVEVGNAPAPRAVRPPGVRLAGDARRLARAQSGAASASTRLRDFLWMLMSFLAGAAAAIGAWSAWFRRS